MIPRHPHITPGASTSIGRTRRQRILLIAYACSPNRGSEESVGWDTASALARRGFDVTVLTQTAERNQCPSASERPDGMRIVCHDLPLSWSRRFERMGKLGVEFGYLWWLQSARTSVRQLHHQFHFDSAQHVTYARYWMPSPLRVFDIPWILGPVGGGESIPKVLRSTLSRGGRLFEMVRDIMRWTGEHASAVRHAASSCSVALANTEETASRMRHLGARTIEIMNSAALADNEVDRLSSSASPHDRHGFISIGRLLDWKGFHLGLEAFARSGATSETYTIVGSGPYRAHLESLAQRLGIADRVRFAGLLDRSEVFELISRAKALVHPSLHESGGFVVLEAMSAGTPVVCIRTGGPGLFVTPETGFAVSHETRERTIDALSDAMTAAAGDQASWFRMHEASMRHIRENHTMSVKADRLADLHRSIIGSMPRRARKIVAGRTDRDGQKRNSRAYWTKDGAPA